MDTSSQIKKLADIAWRRKWWIVVPSVLGAITGLALVATTPRVYRATTTILVTRQTGAEDLVRSSVTLRIEERMRSLQVQILSRSYLEQIAREFKILSTGAGEAEIDETCQRLRAQIIPELDKPAFSWFRISVDDVEPRRAADIANRLASLFIEQNARMRASQAAGTLEATENWEDKYGLELAKRDKDIAEFTQQNVYELPDQQQANLQLLDSAQSRATQLTSDIQSRNDRLAALQTQREAQRAISAASGLPDSAGANDVWRATLQRELAELLAIYTEENPIVRQKRAQIADLVRTPPAAEPEVLGSSAATAGLDPTSLQIVAIENEIKALERDRVRENANVQIYRARINNAPQRQQRYLALTRDYDTVKHQFDTAVAQKEQAQRAQDLEESKKSEQFQIQDRAYPPTVPYKPNFMQYVLAGIGFGLVLGVGATAAREFTDQTVRSEDEFAAFFPDLPVYGVIPNLDADLKLRLRSRASTRGAGSRVASILVPVLAAMAAAPTALLERSV